MDDSHGAIDLEPGEEVAEEDGRLFWRPRKAVLACFRMLFACFWMALRGFLQGDGEDSRAQSFSEWVDSFTQVQRVPASAGVTAHAALGLTAGRAAA